MTAIQWKAQAWLWRNIARTIPTCFLQWELNTRAGVKSYPVKIGDARTVSAKGPCTVTVNSD